MANVKRNGDGVSLLEVYGTKRTLEMNRTSPIWTISGFPVRKAIRVVPRARNQARLFNTFEEAGFFIFIKQRSGSIETD